MTITQQRVARLKRWRGMILELVYQGHFEQQSRLDDVALWGLMRDLGQPDLGLNHVRTLLQELSDDEYLRFDQHKNSYTGETEIEKIEITGAGRKLVEKIARDESVLVL